MSSSPSIITTTGTDSSPPAPLIITGIQEGPVDATALRWPGDCGAENIFLGRTRDETHAEHGRLIRLEYEIYEPMANELLNAMALDAVKKFDCRAVRLVHAHGAVVPGEASVVIQTATGHRGESFAACRYLIDRLKHELPIWKHEIWENGKTFVEGCCAHHGE